MGSVLARFPSFRTFSDYNLGSVDRSMILKQGEVVGKSAKERRGNTEDGTLAAKQETFSTCVMR